MVGLVDEAAQLAAQSGDPWLIGLAVVSRCKDASTAVDPKTWREMAGQLDELCSAHDLPPYEWWRDYLRAKAAAVTNDVAGFVRLVDSGILLAQRYGLPVALSIMAVARAMHAQVGGDFALARQRYLDATQAMTRHGALNADEFLTFALLTVSLDEGHDVASMQPAAQALFARFGPLAADVCSLLFARAGDLAEASRLHALATPPRRDYFWVPFTVVRAQSLLALGAGGLDIGALRLEADELYCALQPHEDEIAGIGGIAVVLGPVAQVLGDLAVLLGRTDEARTQYERAARVARLWQASHWVDRALDRLGPVSPDLPRNVTAG